jgi:D-alanine-D-alanine ligase
MNSTQKMNIAVLAGGNSGEYQVSINSAANIMAHLNRDEFTPYLLVVRGDEWFCDVNGVSIPVKKSDLSVKTPEGILRFNLVFNIIHGTPGEDGMLQGYLDLIGIHYTSSGRLTSALTFNKYFCSRYVSVARCVNHADVVLIRKGSEYAVDEILEITGLPCFVKPNKGGSSVGMSKVKQVGELVTAIVKAFEQDDEVLIEAFVAGTEVTCGVYAMDGQLVVLPLTEIVSKTEYFDYEAKYHGKSDEITPARIPEELATEIKRISALLFRHLDCRGFVRFDYIISDRGIFFLEVNTVPGMSRESIIPQMLAYHGLPLQDFLTGMIREALRYTELSLI